MDNSLIHLINDLITDESVLVAADSVVSEGEAETHYGAGEESHEHGLKGKLEICKEIS